MDPRELLAKTEIFSSLHPQHKEQIAVRLRRREFTANQDIVEQGFGAVGLESVLVVH
jgi:hypothetical protein